MYLDFLYHNFSLPQFFLTTIHEWRRILCIRSYLTELLTSGLFDRGIGTSLGCHYLGLPRAVILIPFRNRELPKVVLPTNSGSFQLRIFVASL